MMPERSVALFGNLSRDPTLILFDSYEVLARRLSVLDQERAQIQMAVCEENLLIKRQGLELYGAAIDQASARSTAV